MKALIEFTPQTSGHFCSSGYAVTQDDEGNTWAAGMARCTPEKAAVVATLLDSVADQAANRTLRAVLEGSGCAAMHDERELEELALQLREKIERQTNRAARYGFKNDIGAVARAKVVLSTLLEIYSSEAFATNSGRK